MRDHFTVRLVDRLYRWDRRFVAGLLTAAALAFAVAGVVLTRDTSSSWGTSIAFLLLTAVFQGIAVLVGASIRQHEVPPDALGVASKARATQVARTLASCAQRVQENRVSIERVLDGSAKDKSDLLSNLSVSTSYIEEWLADSLNAVAEIIGEGDPGNASDDEAPPEEGSDVE